MADDDEWRFSVDEVGPDDEEETASVGADGDTETDAEESDAWGMTVGEDDDGPTVTVGGPERAAEELNEEDGNVAGSLAPETPVERGTPEFENALFVAVGALVTIVVFVSLIQDDPVVLGGIAASAAVAMAALYVFFTRV